MPISARVSSSAQSSTTTAMFATLSLKGLGSLRSDFSTRASNCRRVMPGILPCRAAEKGPDARRLSQRSRWALIGGPAASEAAHPLDVDDVRHLANRRHDGLELAQVRDLDDEVVDASPVVGPRHLGLGDVAVAGGDGAGDLGQQTRAV